MLHVVLSDLELHFSLLSFVCFIHDYRCSSFVRFFRFMAEFFLSSFKAAISSHGKLFLGLLIVISASCVLTLSK